QDYYGKELRSSEDLKTMACVTPAQPLPQVAREALERVHEEVAARWAPGTSCWARGWWDAVPASCPSPRYYGCGLVLPECLASCRVLDLGSGSGRDCYVLSQLVGEKGHITGIDMTKEQVRPGHPHLEASAQEPILLPLPLQVEVARKHVAYHMDKFGYRVPNVDFIWGFMEKLGDAGLADESYDVVVSNCVVNLAPDKRAVLWEAYRVLKPGGELHFSDVYTSGHLSEAARAHRVLWGECLAGALRWTELCSIARELGFSAPRLLSASPVAVCHPELQSVAGDCRFVSATCRLFKVPQSGRARPGWVTYSGGITGHEQELVFDANFTFKGGAGEGVDVDADTATILRSSRFAQHFSIQDGRADAGAALTGCC
ncbi:AS3MT methyltransferase, partial [Crypturellus undulatus]|nr:AS3MT methyltransferase [Crypturellus undulatus]